MKTRKTIISYLLTLVMLVTLAAPLAALADEEADTPADTPVPTTEPAPADTPSPTAAPEPESTPEPEPEPTELPATEPPSEEDPRSGGGSGPADDDPWAETESASGGDAGSGSSETGGADADDPWAGTENSSTVATEEELTRTGDADSATERVLHGKSTASHPQGSIRSTLRNDNVSGSVAAAGYFPSKSDILSGRVGQAFTASMITWHRDQGAACYRIKETSVFAGVFGGKAEYTPQPGDLIYYQAYASEYDSRIITSGNSNWLHVGIVSEVGDDYIRTIEGNTFQQLSTLTFSTGWYGGGMADFKKTWIVNIFGDDVDARSAYVKCAQKAAAQAEQDAMHGRSGYGSWCESCYNGEYQNDTIASGYFQCPAAWCEMFVLWCAFNADIVRTGTVDITVANASQRLLSTVVSRSELLSGYEFRFYSARSDGDYADAEPRCVLVTDAEGNASTDTELTYGAYHIEFDRPLTGGGQESVLSAYELEISAKATQLCFVTVPEDDGDDADAAAAPMEDDPVVFYQSDFPLERTLILSFPDSASAADDTVSAEQPRWMGMTADEPQAL